MREMHSMTLSVAQLDNAMLAGLTGSVVQTTGLTVAVAGMPAPVGAVVGIARQSGGEVEAEVIGFRDQRTLVMPLSDLDGVRRGSEVRLIRTTRGMKIGPGLLGRVIDARGKCIDGRPQPMLADRFHFQNDKITATERPRIDTPLGTGVRCIDGMLT